jgi:hypothetical protein
MEKRAKEFIEMAGRLYEQNKNKWSHIVDDFDEDVYSDTILKVYDSILKGADTEGDLQGYWFRAFKNNLNKNHKQDIIKEDVEQTLKDKEDEINNINLYYSTISNILYKVRHKFDRKTFEVFRMHLLCNMSYEQLDVITGVDSKERISRVRRWINGNKDIR